METIVKNQKLALCIILIACLMAGVIFATCISATAETVLPEEGRGFDAGDDLALVKDLEVQPKTYEAVFYAPSAIKRSGVLFGNYYNGDAACINFEIHNNGYPSVYLQDGAGNTMSTKFSNVDARVDDWVHLIITHEVNENGAVYNCYINGVLADTITSELSYELDMSKVQFTHPLTLGRDNRSGNAQYFKGKIKTVALYSDVLTAEEIKASYENGVNTSNTELMAYYQLDNTDADGVNDLTGNGYNLHARIYPNREPIASTDYDYSFAIVGDTQKHVYNDAYKGTNYVDYIYDWIVANKDSKKIEFVMGLGDITDKNGKDNTSSDGIDQTNIEWEIAVEQHEKLTAAGIPYSVIQGNHDTVAQLDKFFAGNGNFANADIGYYSENSLGNYYIKFTAGSEKYMVVGLQYGPTDAMIAWAGEAIKANPDRKVIITTHAYLKTDATTIDMFYGGTFSRKPTTKSSTANNGNQIWSDLASQYENVIMVLSGHVPCGDIKVRQDIGVNGNTVTQFLIDPQGIDLVYGYKTGMVAMFYFSDGGKTVRVEYVSTYHSLENNDGKDYLYNYKENKFTFTIPETVEPSDVECEYGIIDGWYSNPITYPFAVFKADKSFIGGYGELSDAINAVQAIGDDGDYVIYMRKNAELRDMPAYLTDFEGTLTIDLGGNKLLKANDGVIFYAYVQNNGDAALDENGFDVGGRFVLKNGTVLKYGTDPIAAVNYGDGFVNSYKVFFEFDNVTFIDKNGGDYSIFAPWEAGNANSGDACIYPTAVFNDCTFDYASSTVPPSMINLTNVNGFTRSVWDVKINGGKIVSNSAVAYNAFVKADKGTEGREDKVTFGTGADGKNLILRLPAGSTASTASTIWETDGGYVGFVSDGGNDYEMQPIDGVVTKYGVIPTEYTDATLYPILLFKNGVFYKGYDHFIGSKDGDSGALYAAKCAVDGNNDGEKGSTVQMLFQADVYANSYYKNIGQCQGTIIIDLNGYKLIQNYNSTSFFYTQAKQWSSYGIDDTTFEFCNGEIVLQTELFYFGATGSEYNGSVTDTKYKTFHLSFDNVRFTHIEGSEETGFLGKYVDASGVSGGKKIGYDISFNDCVFDLTYATSIATVMTANDSAIEKCNAIINVKVNGCELITAKPGATLCDVHETNGSSVDFGKGSDGKYLTMTVIGTDEAPAATPNNGDLEFKSVGTDENGNRLYQLSPVGLQTEYGFVPRAYLDTELYPILLFRNGEFVKGYTKLISSTSGTSGDALYAAKCFIDGNNDGEIGTSVQILFRSDVVVTCQYDNLGQCQGTIIIDLNGYKLIQNYSTKPLLVTQAKNWKGIEDCTFEFCNGEIVLKSELMHFGATAAAYNDSATDISFKTFHLSFDNIKFTYAEGASVTTFLGKYSEGSGISDGKKVGYDISFNGCVFDFTNAASMATVMNARDNDITKCNSIVKVKVNGCEMIANTSITALYETHTTNGSSVVFGMGADDKYLTFTLGDGASIPADECYTEDGEKLTVMGENGKYTLVVHSHSYNAVVTAPTCTEAGYTTYTCSCGDSYTADEVPAIGHAYDNDFDADCNNCGEIREVELPNEGAVSKKIFWAFEDGVLSVTGRGKIKNFSAGTAPWSHLNEQITKVVIGEGITYIGSSSFFNFAAIETVELPSTLTAIGRYAFYGCASIKAITIPEAVTEIGAYAFRRSGVENVEFGIGYGWTAGDKAFNITEITAGGHRFISKSYYKLDWVRDVNAPVETLPDSYVDGGIMHTDVLWTITTLESGKLKLTVFGNGMMADYGTACAPWYAYWEQIVEIEVCEGVTSVGRCAFYGLKFVRKVTLADTVTAIGDYGFYMCRLMKEITIPEGVTSIGKDAFVKTGLEVIPTV